MTGRELDKDVRRELSSLNADNALAVSRHLVMAAALLDDDPELALEHAEEARRRAGRLGVVREAVGLAAYKSGKYADALAELRAARRLTGSNAHLPIMADCERGLGRPERALEMLDSPEANQLDADSKAELLIVAAGARADLGQHDAAVAMLRVPQLEHNRPLAWVARLRSAYADALEAVGRRSEAAAWRERAEAADPDGSAGVRESTMDDEGFLDLDEDGDDELVEVPLAPVPPTEQPAAPAPAVEATPAEAPPAEEEAPTEDDAETVAAEADRDDDADDEPPAAVGAEAAEVDDEQSGDEQSLDGEPRA